MLGTSPESSFWRPWMRALLFFTFGCATSCGQVALLSMLTYYSGRFGKSTFVLLNCATYLPSLPIVLLQSKLDGVYDRMFSTAVTFKFRIAVSFLVLTATLVALSLIPIRDEWFVMVCAAIIGIFTGVLFGSFYQLLTFIYEDERTEHTAYYAFGYQGSGFVVLGTSLVAFGAHQDAPTSGMLEAFYLSVAVVPFVALLMFMVLTSTESFTASAQNRDILTSAEDPSRPLLQTEGGIGPENVSQVISEQLESDRNLLRSLGGEHVVSQRLWEVDEGGSPRSPRSPSSAPLSQMQILRLSFPCVACIFVTIFASIVVFPFYTFVPSSNPMFPMVLFYTKIFSDTISRPTTTKLNCLTDPRQLLGAAAMRLVVGVPVFFLYIAGGSAEGGGGLLPRNDAIFCSFIAFFSFTSGYLVTLASQAAPETVPQRHRAAVANQCTIAFQGAFAVALLLALAIRPLLFPNT